MLKTLGILVFILWLNPVFSQLSPPVLQWQKPLGGTLEDFGSDVLLTTDGGFLTLGAARSNNFDGDISPIKGEFDVFLCKYDANRELERRLKYGGSALDYGISIKQVTGGYIILGSTNSNNMDVSGLHQPGLGARPDIWIFKIDENGALIWQKCLGGSETEIPASIDITPTGGYIISGYTNSNNGDVSGNHGGGDIWVAEINSTGDILWQRCYGGSGYDGGGNKKTIHAGGPLAGAAEFTFARSQIKVLAGGGYILTAMTESNDGDIGSNHGNADIWIARLDPSGNILWQTCHGGNEMEMPAGIFVLNDGYVVGGSSASSDNSINNHGKIDGWIFKTDFSGNLLWQHSYGGLQDDKINDIIPAADGGFLLAGGSHLLMAGCNINGEEDFWILKTDDGGKWQWQKNSGGTKDDFAIGIAEAANGLLYITGWELSSDRDVVGHHSPSTPDFYTHDKWIAIYGFDGSDVTAGITITASIEIICEGKPVEFKAHPVNPGSSPTFFWYVNGIEQNDYDGTFIITTLQDGDKVTCKMISKQPCMSDQEVMSNEITIRWYPNGRASGFLPPQITKCVNLYEIIAPTRTFSTYLWSTGATTPTIKVVNPGLYWLEVTDATGCSGRENVWVTTKSCMSAVFVPTAFTPNNDGKNDIFKPLVDGKLLQYHFKIYDRWGQLVMQTTDPRKGWDGKQSGIDQDTNIYVWICTYQLEGEASKTEKGTFLLMR